MNSVMRPGNRDSPRKSLITSVHQESLRKSMDSDHQDSPRKSLITAHQLVAAIYVQETSKLLKEIKTLLQKMSQNVSTIDYLIRLTPTSRFTSEINAKMEDTASLLNQLLPMVRRLVSTPEPRSGTANVYWWLEREHINRELDQILKKFRTMHEYLMNGKMTATPLKTLERILAYEMKLSKEIREVCQEPLLRITKSESKHHIDEEIEIISEEKAPLRSRSMEPAELKTCIATATVMKRSSTRSSVKSCSPWRRKGRRGACITS